jgi:HD domain
MSAVAGPLGIGLLLWLGLIVIAMSLDRAAARGDAALARMAHPPDEGRDAILGVTAPPYPRGLPARLAAQVASILEVDQVWIYSHPADGGPPTVAATYGVHPDPTGCAASAAGGPAAVALPLETASGVSGVLAVGATDDGRALTQEDVDVLCDLGEGVAACLRSTSRAGHPDDPVPSRRCDIETELHELEVTELARAMGEELGLVGVAARELVVAARFHDVGKLQVPEHILDKPGPLDEAEWKVMRRHAAWGADLLLDRPGFEAVATLVRFHHERWDGRGYPRRLAGQRIPLASRILAVCDAYGAMTTDRPYRRALTLDEAAAELHAGAGSQFDPRVVQTFGAQRELAGV